MFIRLALSSVLRKKSGLAPLTLSRRSLNRLVISSALCLVAMLSACGGSSGAKKETLTSNTASENTFSAKTSSALSLSALSMSVLSKSSVSAVSVGSTSTPNNASSSATASVASGALTAPQNLIATPGDASTTLNWAPVASATGYHIYYASQPNIQIRSINSFADGTWVKNVNAPFVIGSLQNNKTYYFVVTAVTSSSEGAASTEVNTTPSAIDLALQPTAQEVLIVELINRARANPDAEALRYGIGLNDGITGTALTATPKPPLAHNLALISAARKHSQWMLDTDTFDHTGVNGSSPGDRMKAAGYVFTGAWSNGENIAWGATGGNTINLTTYALSHHQGLFKSPGHRENMLSAGYREIGIGQKQGNFTSGGNMLLSSMLTEAFAKTGSQYFLTGVVYNDTNSNRFYDVGEGLSGITLTISGKGYAVYATGAYTIPLSNGTYDVSVSGDVLGTPVFRTVQITNANTKLDVVKNGNAVEVIVR